MHVQLVSMMCVNDTVISRPKFRKNDEVGRQARSNQNRGGIKKKQLARARRRSGRCISVRTCNVMIGTQAFIGNLKGCLSLALQLFPDLSPCLSHYSSTWNTSALGKALEQITLFSSHTISLVREARLNVE